MEILNVGIGEMVVIAIIALLVFGPERLPEVARQAARVFGQLRQASDDIRRVLAEQAEPIKEPLEQARREIESVSQPITDLRKGMKSIGRPLDELNREIKETFSTVKSAEESSPPTLKKQEPASEKASEANDTRTDEVSHDKT